MFKGMSNLASFSDVNITPRVFVKKSDGDYLEVAQVQSFERSDLESDENNVSFVMKGRQSKAVNDLLNSDEKEVDVKLEFSLGAVMVMTFSGEIVEFTGEQLTIAMLTPITIDASDDDVVLH